MPVPPNFLKKTLVGIGDRRYINVPGVTYPDSFMKLTPGNDPATGQPYTCPPKGSISTRAASLILGSSMSSARILLKSHKISYKLVAFKGQPPSCFWEEQGVRALAAKKWPLFTEAQRGSSVSVTEAAKYLGVGRTSVQRYIAQGRLRTIKGRVLTKLGPRDACYVLLADLKKLQAHRRAEQLRAAQTIISDSSTQHEL